METLEEIIENTQVLTKHDLYHDVITIFGVNCYLPFNSEYIEAVVNETDRYREKGYIEFTKKFEFMHLNNNHTFIENINNRYVYAFIKKVLIFENNLKIIEKI